MRAVIGLGNPGREYEGTRHNVGFAVLAELAGRWGLAGATWSEKFGAQFLKTTYQGEPVMFIAPMEFMNTSGISASKVLKFFKIDPRDSIVIYDELDLPPGVVRLKNTGGGGGHRGLESLFQHFGSKDFTRVRLGIGHPRDIAPEVAQHNVSAWVLGRPGSSDVELIREGIVRACEAVELLVKLSFKEAQELIHAPRR